MNILDRYDEEVAAFILKDYIRGVLSEAVCNRALEEAIDESCAPEDLEITKMLFAKVLNSFGQSLMENLDFENIILNHVK